MNEAGTPAVGLHRTYWASYLADIYDAYSRFLYKTGRDPFKARQLWAKHMLLNMENSQVCRFVTIRSGKCKASAEVADRPIKIEDAIEQLPVPCTECTCRRHANDKYPWCDCDYQPILEKEKSGRIKQVRRRRRRRDR